MISTIVEKGIFPNHDSLFPNTLTPSNYTSTCNDVNLKNSATVSVHSVSNDVAGDSQNKSGNDFIKKKQAILAVTGLKEPLKLIPDFLIPELKPYEILVENKAIGLNPIDWKAKKYGFGIYSFPWINGRESSGIVVNKGILVDTFDNGEKVFLSSTSYRDIRTSTFQQYTAIDSRLVWKLPKNLTFENAATLGVGLVTASILLIDSFGINLEPLKSQQIPRETIIIWGGTTVVGMYVTQLAKIAGIKVISIASQKHESYLKKLGADVVIDRHNDILQINQDVLENSTNGILYGIDCVSKETSQSVVDLLQLSFQKTGKIPFFSSLVGKPEDLPPDVIEKEVIIKKFHEDVEFGKKLVLVTSKLLDRGLLKPVKHKEFQGDIKKIDYALKQLELNGASAEKYVVKIM